MSFAIVAGAALAGSVVSAGAAMYGANKAAGAAQRGADRASAESARQFDLTRSDTAPARSLGNSAMDTIARLYGWAQPSAEVLSRPVAVGDSELPAGATTKPVPSGKPGWYEVWYDGQRIGTLRPGGPNGRFINDTGFDVEGAKAKQQVTAATPAGRPDMSAFFESPDYQFNLAEGQKAIDRSLAARGRALSGAGVREGERYASGLASNEYSNFLNRLTTIAGLGNAAVNTSASAGMTSAGQIGAAQINAGNTRASAYMTGAQGVNDAVQGGISNALLMRYLSPGSTPMVPNGGVVDPYANYAGGGMRTA